MQDRRMRARRAIAAEGAAEGIAAEGMAANEMAAEGMMARVVAMLAVARLVAMLVAMLVLASVVAPRPALAQTAAPQTAPAPAAAAEPAASGTPATVVDDDQIGSVLGKKVKSPAGEDMGRIVDVLVDRTGAIRAAVVDFGGFFGVGTRKIAVDWHALHFGAGAKSDSATADLPAERLRVSPVYKEGEPVVILGPSPAVPPTPAAPPVPAVPAQK